MKKAWKKTNSSCHTTPMLLILTNIRTIWTNSTRLTCPLSSTNSLNSEIIGTYTITITIISSKITMRYITLITQLKEKERLVGHTCIKVMYTILMLIQRACSTCNSLRQIIKVIIRIIGHKVSIKTIKVTFKNTLKWTLNMWAVNASKAKLMQNQ